MSQPLSYGGDQEPQGTGDQGGSGNPAWQPFLEAVPQEYHEAVTPVLKEWDQGVQNKIQKVHSEYEPWKPIMEYGDPETAQFALNLLNTINEKPELVYNALGEYYGLAQSQQSGQGQGSQIDSQQQQYEDDPYEHRFATLEQQNEQLARALLDYQKSEQQARAQQEADAQLEEDLNNLRQTYGDYNERAVLNYMLGGLEPEEAYQAWVEDVSQFRAKPLIQGPGGGMPGGNNVDVRKLDEKGTRNLVAQMLEAAQQQRDNG